MKDRMLFLREEYPLVLEDAVGKRWVICSSCRHLMEQATDSLHICAECVDEYAARRKAELGEPIGICGCTTKYQCASCTFSYPG